MNGLANDQDTGGVETTAGWFGKLACLGDFASRRLAPDFTQACDAWLSRCVEASRAQLGERWLETYLTSPLWRFAWAPGSGPKKAGALRAAYFLLKCSQP